MRISDWSSDVCSSDLCACPFPPPGEPLYAGVAMRAPRPILPELKPGTTPGIFSRPFFEDKNRAFWMLQGAGWLGYLLLRTVVSISNGDRKSTRLNSSH